MAHYALLNYNNIVTKVITGKDESSVDYNMELVYQDMFKQVCKRTSYNTRGGVHTNNGTPFRKNFAGIGYTYDESRDAFIPPKPFDSWVINESTCTWRAPSAMPVDNNRYDWNETSQAWEQIT
jgi:hypothetical protein